MGGGSYTERMRIHTNGNVGIGTTIPGAKLQINGATADGTANALIVRNSSLTGLFSIRNDGRVDIAAGALVQSGGGYANTSSNSSYFTGNLGIGTTSPAQKLEVVGTIQATSTGTATLILRGDSNNSDDTGQLDSTIKMLHDDGNHGILLETRNYTGAQSFEIKSLAAAVETSRFLIDTDGTLKIPAYGAGFLTTDANGAVSVDATSYVDATGDTMTGDLTIQRGLGDLTFLTLKQENTSSDLVAQKSFIDFTFVDSNSNETPQVRIGAEVGNNDGSASTQAEEGMGAFVVYTNNADTDAGAAGNSLAERFRVDRLGNVGIGTTSPDHSLQIERSTGDHLKLSRSGVGSFELGVVSSNALKFSDGGAERMRIASNGNVGIGTTSPSEKLHVSGNARIEGDLTVNGSYTQIDTDVNTTEQWNVTNDGTGPAVTINQTGAQDIMDVQDDGTSVFYIEDGGNVGIGTNTPVGKFNSYISATRQLTHNGNGGDLSIISDNNSAPVFYVKGTGTADLVNIFDNTTEVFTILDGGNVGVGTTSPSQKLEVIGNIKAGAGAADNYIQSIHSDGTQTRMHGYGLYMSRTSSYIRPINDNTQTLYIGSAANQWSTVSIDATTTLFNVNGSEKMRITSTGNVGIGTNSPTATLHTKASGNGTYVLRGMSSAGTDLGGLYQSGTGDAEIYLKTSAIATNVKLSSNGTSYLNGGNVGIGITSPGYKLDVAGSARIALTTDTRLIINQDTASTNFGLQLGYQGTRNWDIYNNGAADSKLFFYSEQLGGNAVTFTPTGRVGIGTTSPSVQLDIEDSSNVIIDLNTTTANANTTIRFQEAGTVKATMGYEGTSDVVLIANGGFTAGNGINIDSSNNVGIGTTSPTSKLHISSTGFDDHITLERGSDSLGISPSGGQLLVEGGLSPWGNINEDLGRIDKHWNEVFVYSVRSGGALQFKSNGNNERMRIDASGNVGIGYTSPTAKLSVSGAILAGGKYSYRKGYGSLDTTGAAIAGLSSASNGASAMFKFEMHGGLGHYQKVVYSCYNAGGNWFANKVIDEGTNELDVEASANNNTTITFTFKARNSTQSYSPAVEIEASGATVNTTYL
jgi:hypothetical protein